MVIGFICTLVGIFCGTSDTDDTFVPYKVAACENSGSMSTGYEQYKAVDASPGRCKWVIDIEAMKLMDEREKAEEELWWALRTRPLTDDEMAEVKRQGISLIIRRGKSFNEEELLRELNDALVHQYQLQEISRKNR